MQDKLAKIGQSASLKTQWGFIIHVIVKDYKNSYGKDRWHVEPLSGNGGAWVEGVIFD